MLLTQGGNGPLDLLKTPLGLQLGDHFLNLIVCPAPEGPAALVLIIVGHLGAQMAAAGVDHQKQAAILRPVHLDKMVAAAQCADAPPRPAQVDPVGAAQLCQINFGVAMLVYKRLRPVLKGKT